jgi:hypothetical protein
MEANRRRDRDLLRRDRALQRMLRRAQSLRRLADQIERDVWTAVGAPRTRRRQAVGR